MSIWSAKSKSIFEIGTFDGFSTVHLAKNSPPDSIIHTLNLPLDSSLSEYNTVYSLLEFHEDTKTHEVLKKNGVGILYRNSDVAHKVKQLYGNSLTFDFSSYHHSIDLCFIDGGHAEIHVRNDSDRALSMLKPGGAIIWHDYNVQHRDVYRYLNSLAKTHKLYHILGTRLVFYLQSP